MPAFFVFALRYWQLLLGAAGVLVLGIMLADAKSDVRDWKEKASKQAQLYQDEQKAHLGTISNYRLAQAEAIRVDAANKARVEAQQRAINERTVNDYEARIAAVRERYAGLVRTGATSTNPGSRGSPPVPRSSATAVRTDGAAPKDRLPLPDALIATEQAIQLEALQAWVRQQARVEN